MVDVHDETVRIRELHGENFHAGEIVLDARADLVLQLSFLLVGVRHGLLSKKMGPPGPSRLTGENGRPIVARRRPNGLSPQPSRTIVTGPSFTSSTAIEAPKTPRATGTPRASRSVQNRSYSGSAASGGAAAA